LPLLGQHSNPERADARRNRERVLAAAARLFAERGPHTVTLDDVVAAAGVGKGTLFRRFGDKQGLAAALLDGLECDLQRRILTGPPPLGPGAPASDRLAAFVAAYLRYVADNRDLVAMSQTASPGARFRTGAHHFWRQHLLFLLRQQGATDPGVRAEVILAALSAEQVGAWLGETHVHLDALTQALVRLTAALAARSPDR
jgi:AcrR family transcriptional regulator